MSERIQLELENVIERGLILAAKNVIQPEDLPAVLLEGEQGQGREHEVIVGGEQTLEELEKKHILSTLERVAWNQKKASDILGISTTTLWRKLKSYGIEPKRKEDEN